VQGEPPECTASKLSIKQGLSKSTSQGQGRPDEGCLAAGAHSMSASAGAERNSKNGAETKGLSSPSAGKPAVTRVSKRGMWASMTPGLVSCGKQEMKQRQHRCAQLAKCGRLCSTQQAASQWLAGARPPRVSMPRHEFTPWMCGQPS